MPRRKMTEEEKKERDRKKKEDQILKNLESWVIDHQRKCDLGYIPFPPEHRTFKVGDRVEFGNHKNAIVKEVYADGRFYKIFVSGTKQRYSKDVSYSSTYIESWMRILPYRTKEERDTPEKFMQNEDIFFQYSQRDLNGLIYASYEFGIDMDVDYQRELVWSHGQKLMLIDSIFKNIDIGKFALIHRPYESGKDSYEILDGKQRLTALMEFYEDRFRYKGKLFSELHWRDQIHFEHYSISWAETKNLTQEQKYRYFLKLNTSGVPISKEHLDKVREMWKEEVKKTR